MFTQIPKYKAITLLELLVVLSVIAAIIVTLPALIPTFSAQNIDGESFVSLVQKGRLEAMNAANPVVLACVSDSSLNNYGVRWGLWELSEPTPRLIDELKLSPQAGLDFDNSQAKNGVKGLEIKELSGINWCVWHYPQTGSATTSGVIVLGSRSYLFNTLGNLVTIL